MATEKPSNQGISREGFFHYRLLAMAAGIVADKLKEEKAQFSREYRFDGNDCPPSVTVCEFLATHEMEETILRWLQRITGEQETFAVTLNNYTGYPLHNVSLRIRDHEPFHLLATRLEPIDRYLRSYDCPPVHFTRHPNLPVAEGLPVTIYEQAISEYSQRDFNGSFEVTELMLVRQGAGDAQPLKRAVLRLLPAATMVLTN